MKDSGQLSYRHSFVESNGTVVAYSDSNLSVDEWTHVVFTRDSSTKTMRFYINGVASSQYTYTIDPKTSNSEKLIFGFCDGCVNPNKFSGKLDEIKIYNIALTGGEITAIYNSENGGEYSTGGCHPSPLLVNDNADLPFEGEITVDILANDRDNDSATCFVDASTVMIRSNPTDSNLSDDNRTLVVIGEGRWSVENSGSISFVSESSFLGNPVDINYSLSDNCGNLSNEATISLTRIAQIVPTPTPKATPIPTPTQTPLPTPKATPIPTSTPTPTPIPVVVTPTPSSPTLATPIETIVPIPVDTSSSLEDTNITLGDLVWYDIDRNGIQDSSEHGVENITVVLFEIDGSVVDRTVTDASGIYQFSVPAGSYTIGFSNLPENYSFTSQNMGSSDAKDSDVDSSGRTEAFTISDVENSSIYDAGVVSPIDVNITIRPSVDDNVTTIVEDCECDDYKTAVPSMNIIGLVAIWLLVSLLGVLFLRGDDFNFNKK